ncbi:hypothetical protein [Oceanirhabdus seepicola]|uniref:Leucine-rich repeat domain-containing protein n=1 Tax=Oceanirhabdus seepicola TaxID=2828781 RepID=A0A9J6NZR0_9CLOT|nr:hypothetical protein [Oceanirhabdus seepicola]MCM1989580.1 hypothetical protein [Oceanirhabdus seepicola]
MKFNNIIKNYLHSFNLFEHICLGVVFLEFIFFISPGTPPSTVHIFLLLFLPLLIIERFKKPGKFKNIIRLLFIILFGSLSKSSPYFWNISLAMDLNLQIIVTILFIIVGIISINIRKDKKATLKSLFIIGMFSILFLSNILYNNQHYISNPQIRNNLSSKITSSRSEEDLTLFMISLRIGENTNITNLKDIEKFKNLKYIFIDGYARNIDGLFELQELEFIKFRNSDSNILYKINKFKTLNSIEIDGLPSIKEDFILNDMPNLEELYISDLSFGDIDFIGELNNLQLLELYMMDLENVDTIHNLKSLKYIDLYATNIYNIDGILSNDSIEEIHYLNSNITDYEEVLKEKGIKLVKKDSPISNLRGVSK